MLRSDTLNYAVASRSTGLSLLLTAGTLVAGLLLRFAPLGLPAVAVKYGGSMMWALLIYWLLSTVLGSRRPATLLLLAGSVATAVELLKLYRSPRLDAFRLTLPGILLLGRYFSVWDIVAYWLAILAGALLDARFLRAAQGYHERPLPGG